MEAGGEAAGHSGKREKDDGAQLTFSFLSQPQAPVHAAVTPTCSADVPTAVSPVWKLPHRQAHGFIP